MKKIHNSKMCPFLTSIETQKHIQCPLHPHPHTNIHLRHSSTIIFSHTHTHILYTHRALAVKDRVLTSLDYAIHPGKAWKEFVANPLNEAREREREKKAAERARLEKSLARYHAAKNRFYDTLDVISDT